ncbi:SLAM family member 9-like [Dendrobates tinctorius]|uniref:SLAM family member 9-like n=1 Tax=Dendrobates tinctorius TaxID=92724 RepID=UPI003CC94312
MYARIHTLCPAKILTMNLENLFGLAALILFPLGEANILVHHPALLHRSVSISHSPSQKTGTIRTITWRFDKCEERVLILDTTEKPFYIYDSQFRNRLLISEDLYTMTIKDLTMEDGGIYSIDATDTNGRTDSYSFNVTVYEPAPQPTITTHVKERTGEQCNVTLNCSVVPSHTSDVSYTWKYRHQNSTYQMYSNGSTIQISVPPDHQDMELLCIVQNPADQKNVSISVMSCTDTGRRAITPISRNHIIILVSITTLILCITMAVTYIRIKHKGISEPKGNRNAEIDYIEVTTQRREDNQIINMENDHYIGMPSPQKVKVETVYTTLQHPQPKYMR